MTSWWPLQAHFKCWTIMLVYQFHDPLFLFIWLMISFIDFFLCGQLILWLNSLHVVSLLQQYLYVMVRKNLQAWNCLLYNWYITCCVRYMFMNYSCYRLIACACRLVYFSSSSHLFISPLHLTSSSHLFISPLHVPHLCSWCSVKFHSPGFQWKQ